MPKYTTIECEKCRQKKITEFTPLDWVTAEITKGREEPITWYWCPSCWREISAKKPEMISAQI